MHFEGKGENVMEVSGVSRCVVLFWRSMEPTSFYRQDIAGI